VAGEETTDFAIGQGECPFLAPFYYVNHQQLIESPETSTLNYTISENIKFISYTDDPTKSYFAIYTQNNGFQSSFNFTMIDVRGFTVS